MAASLLRKDRVMADNEPLWQCASDLLLVVAVAAMALGLVAVGMGLSGADGAAPSAQTASRGDLALEAEGACPPSAAFEAACGRVHADGGRDAALDVGTPKTAPVGHPGASDVIASIGRSVVSTDSPPMPVAEDDPREFLAHMTAVMHRRGLPLPVSQGRIQSLIDQPADQGDDAPSMP
jgi:hypothetical protein